MHRRQRHPRTVALVPLLGLLILATSLSSGCALTEPRTTGRTLVPNRYQTTVGPYRIWTNGPVVAEDPAIHQLLGLENQLRRQLALRVDPAESPVDIYILDDQSAFEHFLKFYYPELPTRRAFFLARGNKRVVYAYRGERLIEDLRHEATHALLHASIADMPLWLDEGLAEYFEVPEDWRGVNAEHVRRLPRDLADGWSPDLERLERLRDVREMTPRDYRESWAWVHYLIEGPATGRTALLGYLADLRSQPRPTPLSSRLAPGEQPAEIRMVAHLEQVRHRPIAAAPATTTPRTVVRGQDPTPAAEVVLTPAPPPKRGAFGRILDAIGLGR